MAATVLSTLREEIARRREAFLLMVDAESIVPFQQWYYPMIILFTSYLAFAADAPPQSIEDTLGTTSYHGWLLLGTVFPAMTMIGRHLYNRAPKTQDGQPSSASLGARMQFVGDCGVWASICIYMACVFNTLWWGQGLWAVGFVAMGVPGGFLFVFRSWRRLRQIGAREARNKGIVL